MLMSLLSSATGIITLEFPSYHEIPIMSRKNIGTSSEVLKLGFIHKITAQNMNNNGRNEMEN
jgi:hypothetical protein